MAVSPGGAPLRVFLLGQPRFEAGGVPHRFSSLPKALPLLAYLILRRHAPLPREKVAFTIWEDETEEDARANLRRHIYQVQRALPPPPRASSPWIISDGDTVQWNPVSGAWTDVAEFERLAASERDRAAAVDLYGGELLEGSYDEWIFADRDRLRNLYHSLLDDLVVECRSTRDLARAATYAQRILTSDPWREDTVRHLMAVRYESGDRAGAVAAYQQFDKRLREEMGVEPMQDTIALRDLIMRNEPLASVLGTSGGRLTADGSQAGDDADAPFGNASAPLLPFVGRGTEMERLRMAWSRAARGHGRIVLIGGEAGIGKSRLAAEFALHAQAQGGRLLSGTTTYPEGKPFQAIAEALRGAAPLLVSLDIAPIWLGVAGQAVPELRVRKPDLPMPPDVDPDHERLRLFEAFAVCLEALAKQRPLALIIEDLHWAGEATVAAIQFIVRRFAHQPVLVVATYREEDAPRAHPLRRMRRELQEEKTLITLSPRPLGRDDVADLLTRVGGARENGIDADATATVLLERSAGNPLFLNELIQGLRESGGSADRVALPETARQAIAQRVSRLDEGARSLAEVAAVVGQGFDVDLVRDVSGWPENDVLDGLSQLIDRRIVRESGRRSGYAYVFTHHLVQDTIYSQIAEDARVMRHRRTAKALEETYPERLAEFAADIARHREAGREPVAAAAAYLRAAQQAFDVYAYDEALGYLARCLALDASGTHRRDVLVMREIIRSRRGERASQREDLAELERMAAASGDARFVAGILWRSILFARAIGDPEREASLVAEFAALAAGTDDKRVRAESLVATAAHATLVGDHARGVAAATDALALYRELGDLAGQLEARCRHIEIETEAGTFDVAMEMLADLRKTVELTGDKRLLARALSAATHAAIASQRYAECLDLTYEARELCRRVGDLDAEADVIVRQGAALTRLARFEDARERYDEAAAIYTAIGKRHGAAAVAVNGAIVSVHLGLLDAAETSMRAAHGLFVTLEDVRGQAASAINLGFVHLLRKDPLAAKQVSLAALELACSMEHAHYQASALANLGQAERDIGDLDSAIDHMSQCVAIRRARGTLADNVDDLVNLAYVYMLAGESDAAMPLAQEMWPSLESMTTAVVFMPQFALWMAAQVYRGLGDRERSQTMLARAHDAVERQASMIVSAAEREVFLGLDAHREIEAAFARKRWPALEISRRSGAAGDGPPAAGKRAKPPTVTVKAGDDGR